MKPVSVTRESRKTSYNPLLEKRLPGAGRKAKLLDMEEQLASGIIELRSKNCRVTRAAIQRKALELHNGEEDFTASRGWLSNFFKHHNFSLRRRTTVGQKLPQDHIQKICSYLMRLRKMGYLNSYSLSSIGNIDETPLWLDMPGDTTVARVAEHSIPICTTGHDKGCFTVILTALADGKKFKPFVVFKVVCPIHELTVSWSSSMHE
uniref:HTH CENPB-type domain-containing protein n=1 Tax=Amphimedon queenslandica TaxID=400682 RepID=A0A1X7UBJ9_AMPQE